MCVGPTFWFGNLELGPVMRVSLTLEEKPLRILSATSLTVDSGGITIGMGEAGFPGSFM